MVGWHLQPVRSRNRWLGNRYLFAVDRNNKRVAEDYSPARPVFWRLVEGLARAARAAKRPLSICGEMAADPRFIARLLNLGIQTVSVSARHIPGVRRAVRAARRSAARPAVHGAGKQGGKR